MASFRLASLGTILSSVLAKSGSDTSSLNVDVPPRVKETRSEVPSGQEPRKSRGVREVQGDQQCQLYTQRRHQKEDLRRVWLHGPVRVGAVW